MTRPRASIQLQWMPFPTCLAKALTLLLLASAWDMAAGAERNTMWIVETSYPQDTVAGEAVDSFASALESGSGAAVKVRSLFSTSRSLGDIQMPMNAGSATIASVLFAGELVATSPVFELSTLPVNVRSVDEAKELARLAKARYRKALARSGYRLLAVVPWPPTGIWTRVPLATPGALSEARVRTYDTASRKVFSSVSAKAVTLSIQDTVRELSDGTVDAVLSSGDGEAGRIYARHLRHFTAIDYAYPLSFMVVSNVAYRALSLEMRHRASKAAADTETQLWKELPSRISRNKDQMRRLGIQVADRGDPIMRATLRAAGDREVKSWWKRVSREDREVIKLYEKGYRPISGIVRDSAQLSGKASHESD